MGLDLTMLRTPDGLPNNVPEIVRNLPLGYFRGAPFDAMSAADLLDFDVGSRDLPAWPPQPLKERRAYQLLELFEQLDPEEPPTLVAKVKPTYAELRIMQKYVFDLQRMRSARSRKRGRVPAYKFLSNDGWIVTPIECLLIAFRLQVYLKTGARTEVEDHTYIAAFVAYNELAAKWGGYEVW